jgi:hypothetical protein
MTEFIKYFSTSSKDNTKRIFTWIEYYLRTYISNNNRLNGFFVFVIHLLLQFIVYFFLLSYPICSTFFYSAFIIWTLIIVSNFYFKGCLLLKLERYLWNTKTWYGPIYMFCDNSDISPTTINNFFICRQLIVITLVFMRILFY